MIEGDDSEGSIRKAGEIFRRYNIESLGSPGIGRYCIIKFHTGDLPAVFLHNVKKKFPTAAHVEQRPFYAMVPLDLPYF